MRLPFKPNAESSNPFARRAEILNRLRKVDPCGFPWSAKGDPDHIHRCTKHRTHGVTHLCNCGAAISRKKGEKVRPAPEEEP